MNEENKTELDVYIELPANDVLRLIESFELLAGHRPMSADIGVAIRKMKTTIDDKINSSWELDRVKPVIKEHDSGLALTHNMPCPVLYEQDKPAVYERKTGIFHPSWDAQAKGWRLVQARTWLQRLLVRLFFGELR